MDWCPFERARAQPILVTQPKINQWEFKNKFCLHCTLYQSGVWWHEQILDGNYSVSFLLLKQGLFWIGGISFTPLLAWPPTELHPKDYKMVALPAVCHPLQHIFTATYCSYARSCTGVTVNSLMSMELLSEVRLVRFVSIAAGLCTGFVPLHLYPLQNWLLGQCNLYRGSSCSKWHWTYLVNLQE